MKFVSCIAVDAAIGEESQGDVVLCECDLGERALPENEADVVQLKVEAIVVSEGNEIHVRRGFGCDDLRVFTEGDQETNVSREAIWHELIKLLTGHRVQLDSLRGRVEFTRWVCHAPENETWLLVMELESRGIVRKIAELEVKAVTQGEVDLFQMTSSLFASFCESNDAARALTLRASELEALVQTMREEGEKLEKLREDRDNKTRSIMVGLLNEKKKKIAQLEHELEKRNLLPSLGDISDSEVINKNVKEAVSELISPGKRKIRLEQMDEENKRKLPKKKLSPEPKIKPPADDFDDDFQFFGITKVKQETPSRSSSPKRPNVKQESHEEMTETDSQRSELADTPSRPQSASESETDADTETEPTPTGQPSSESDTDVSLTA